MKGVVFTEFLEMVEAAHSFDMVDTIIEKSHIASQGAYTAVGTYPPEEMVALVDALAAETGTPREELLRQFGSHLFERFIVLYPAFFQNVDSAFDFLPRVDRYIHTEVQKLYPDAALPYVGCERLSETEALVTYRSPRCMGKLARGLIEGCIAHFGRPIAVVETQEPESNGREVLFRLHLQAA